MEVIKELEHQDSEGNVYYGRIVKVSEPGYHYIIQVSHTTKAQPIFVDGNTRHSSAEDAELVLRSHLGALSPENSISLGLYFKTAAD